MLHTGLLHLIILIPTPAAITLTSSCATQVDCSHKQDLPVNLFQRQSGGALLGQVGFPFSKLLQGPFSSPYDPPGAPCLNCDENGNYRVPDRANCRVLDTERNMIQRVKERLLQNPYDYALVDDTMAFVMIALVCTDYVREQGGFDLIFDVIKHAGQMPSTYSTDQRNWFAMRGWMALSDQSVSSVGAPIIANYGGPNKGIEFMVEHLKRHHQPFELKYDSVAHAGIDKLTLRYEITVNIMGILLNDAAGEWGEAAVEAGLLEEAIYTLQVENTKCSPMWSTCGALDYLLLPGKPRVGSYKARLLELGAEHLTERAVNGCTPYQPGGDQAFMAGQSWGQIHPADQTCGQLLTLLRS